MSLCVTVACRDREAAKSLINGLNELGYRSVFCSTFDELLVTLRSATLTLLFLYEDFDEQPTDSLIRGLLGQSCKDGHRLLVILLSSSDSPARALSATGAGAFRVLRLPLDRALLKSVMKDGGAGLGIEEQPAPMDALDDYCAKSSGPGLQAGRRYPMERMSVMNNAPEEPGVITFYGENGEPLSVEFAANLSQRLNYYVDLHPTLSEVARRARFFDVLPTMDRSQEAKIFDRLVNKTGVFPLLMKEAPEGSGHRNPGHETATLHGDGRVTRYNPSPDRAMLDGIKELLAQNPSDPDTQDWLAFTLYSNNLFDEAIAWYTRLITRGSRREEHFFYCGNAFFKKGDVDRAKKLWKVAATINPGSAIAGKSRRRLEES